MEAPRKEVVKSKDDILYVPSGQMKREWWEHRGCCCLTVPGIGGELQLNKAGFAV